MKKLCYYAYILTNKWNTVLYVGITRDLIKRVYEHKHKLVKGFTYKYNIYKLIYYEIFEDINEAIKREKQIKNLVRRKKIALIKTMNPGSEDLYESLV